jgi:hypothetical protein
MKDNIDPMKRGFEYDSRLARNQATLRCPIRGLEVRIGVSAGDYPRSVLSGQTSKRKPGSFKYTSGGLASGHCHMNMHVVPCKTNRTKTPLAA